MQTLTLADTQSAVVTAQPEDANGNPATNFNTATWAVTDGTVCSVGSISSDGLTATITAEKSGTTTVTVTGQQGNFQPTYSSSFTVMVTAGVPTQFVFSFGTPH